MVGPCQGHQWWSRGLEFVGDDYYKRQRLGLVPDWAHATAAAAAAGADVGVSSVNGRGHLPHLMEPWWSRGLEYVGDDYYKWQRLGLQRQHPAAADGVAAADSVNGRGQ
uniref:Uncharacterized protein n=1 Tax=Tetradesmus obliquus TaxID=3088 RepID=A0A383WC39_TETOB|eukprot:jgi/Sobl393_1/12580/SZX75207.1